MQLPHRLTIALLATTFAVPGAALAAATPARSAASKSGAVSYAGRTRHGDSITLTLRGRRVAKVTGSIPVLCVPVHGTPLTGTDAFDPPGSFALGRTSRATAKRPNSMGITSDVTKNFTFFAKRDRSGQISGKLHVDYSYLQILYTYPISSKAYVCTGDTTFGANPLSARHR